MCSTRQMIRLLSVAARPRQSPAASAIRCQICAQPSIRDIHTTSPALKKKPSRANEEIDEDIENQEDDSVDLFAESTGSATQSANPAGDRAARRTALIQSISDLLVLPPDERVTPANELRIGTVRRIVSLTENAEELEVLKSVLKGWRVLGKRVTRKTAEEVIGRCCNLGRADLAVEILNNPAQYGIQGLSNSAYTTLHGNLISTTSETTSTSAVPLLRDNVLFTPTLSLLRLALLSTRPESELSQIPALTGNLGPKPLKENIKVPEWREQAIKMLSSAGGEWAKAAKKLQKQI